jgi:hypothetical protein
MKTKKHRKHEKPVTMKRRNQIMESKDINKDKYAEIEEKYEKSVVFQKEGNKKYATKSQVENKLVQIIKKGIKDTSILPQNDFYSFIT